MIFRTFHWQFFLVRFSSSVTCSRLIRALLFTKSGIFVNPARASPDVFIAEYGRLKLKEPVSVAVCIMTGIVTDCAIISEACAGGPDNEKSVHKISLAPFRQEFRRDTTMWGKILNFDNISCAISTEGLSFSTKPKTLRTHIFIFWCVFPCFCTFVFVSFSFVVLSSESVLSQDSKKGGIPCYDCDAQSRPCTQVWQLYHVPFFWAARWLFWILLFFYHLT
jgi:hypothetical protein